MLTYKLSRREKTLVLILAIILVVVAWFVFVYQRTANEVVSLDSEIASTQTQITAAQTRAAQVREMKEVVEQRKAEGVKPVEMPAYDNMQPLMAELNTVLLGTSKSTLKFDELNTENSGYVARGVRIDYETDSYAAAESVVKALAGGKYPCHIDSFSIEDKSTQSSSNTSGRTQSGAPVKAVVHVTFFESVKK